MGSSLVSFGLFVLVIVVAIPALTFILGQRTRSRATGEPYESGMVPTGAARLRFRAGYYLVAMLFVIFDLEAVFIFVWAVAVRASGWTGYIEILIFVLILLAGLIYLWREGALEWGRWQPDRNAGGNGAAVAPRKSDSFPPWRQV